MTFKPYVIYSARLPILKPGHFIKAANKMWQIVGVRINRQPIVLDAGAVSIEEPTPLNVSENEAYKALHGDKDQGRITHMHYLALSTAINVTFKWGLDPLFSKWENIAINNVVAEVDGPIQVDRWSYSEEMRVAYGKDAGAQTTYFEIVEYEIKETALKPKKYLKVLPNGHATFIEV